MKKLTMLLSVTLLAGLANAAVIYSTDFTTNSSNFNGPLDDQPGWDAQAGYVVTNADTTGTLLTLNDWGRAKVYPAVAMGTALNETNKIIITTDFWYGEHGTPGGDLCQIGIADSSVNTGGDMPKVYSYLKSFAPGFSYSGAAYTLSGTNSWIRWQIEIEKSETPYEFQLTSSFSNLTSGANIGSGTVTVVETNTYNAASVNVGIRSQVLTGATELKWDNFTVETEVVSTTFIDDDFDGYTGSLTALSGWGEMKHGNSPWVSGGTAWVQDGPATVGQGWRGAVYKGRSLQPAAGETVRVEMDWKGFINGQVNANWCDIVLTTNSVDDDATVAYSDAADVLGVRMRQTFGGNIAVDANGGGMFSTDLANIGLDDSGADTGDVCRVIFEFMKMETDDMWNVSMLISNTLTGALYADVGNSISNAIAYDAADLYFGISYAGNVADAGNIHGYEIDNLLVEIELPADPLPDGVFIDEDFNDFWPAALDDQLDWDQLNNAEHMATTGGVAIVRPGQGYGNTWRGTLNSANAITGVDVGDMVEVSFDYKMYAREGALSEDLLDVVLATSYVDAPITYDNTNAVGVRVAQKNTNVLRIDNPGAANFVTSLTNVNVDLVGGDYTSEWCRVTYAATKTETADTWSVDITVSNMTSSFSESLLDVDVVAANAYNASELFFGFYGPTAYRDNSGVEVDNLYVQVVTPALAGFDLFVDTYGLSGTKTADKDGDGLSDWGEYVFGGHPDGGVPALGTQPSFDASAGVYNFSLIGDNTVVAHVVTNLDLVSGSWGTNATVNVSATDGVLSNYTDNVGTGADEMFIRLLVE